MTIFSPSSRYRRSMISLLISIIQPIGSIAQQSNATGGPDRVHQQSTDLDCKTMHADFNVKGYGTLLQSWASNTSNWELLANCSDWVNKLLAAEAKSEKVAHIIARERRALLVSKYGESCVAQFEKQLALPTSPAQRLWLAASKKRKDAWNRVISSRDILLEEWSNYVDYMDEFSDNNRIEPGRASGSWPQAMLFRMTWAPWQDKLLEEPRALRHHLVEFAGEDAVLEEESKLPGPALYSGTTTHR
jgi:hypothetical protein